jgi:hypothetical protein
MLQWLRANPNLANEIKLLFLRHNSLRYDLSDTRREVITHKTHKPSNLEFMDVSESALARYVAAIRACGVRVRRACVRVCESSRSVPRREFTTIEFQLFRDVDLRSLLTVKTQDGDSLFEPLIAQYNMVRSLAAPPSAWTRQSVTNAIEVITLRASLLITGVSLGGARDPDGQEGRAAGARAREVHSHRQPVSPPQ